MGSRFMGSMVVLGLRLTIRFMLITHMLASNLLIMFYINTPMNCVN